MKWESDVKELFKEHGETINEKTRVAIVTMMCPSSIQDVIFQTLDENTTYMDLKNKNCGAGN